MQEAIQNSQHKILRYKNSITFLYIHTRLHIYQCTKILFLTFCLIYFNYRFNYWDSQLSGKSGMYENRLVWRYGF